MTEYVSKRITINAIQFTGDPDNWTEIQKFVGYRTIDNETVSNFVPAEHYYVDVPEGIVAVVWDKLQQTWVGVKLTDYIIQGTSDEFYPCDLDVFEFKYERKNVK